jgi:hypothetical protein
MSTRLKPWIDRDPSERRTIVNGTFVPRDLCDSLVERMDRVRRNMREGARPACITFVGEAGVGKSALLQNYAAGNPISETTQDGFITRTRPVLYVEFAQAMSVGQAADLTLCELLGPTAPQGARARYIILPEQLRLQGVELMIFDEFQHVLEKGADKTQGATRDWVKYLTKKTRIPAVLAGMKAINDIVDGDPQLYQLTPHRFKLPHYDYSTKEEKKEFRRFLADLDRRLPFDELAHLADPDRARRLHLSCRGFLRPFSYVLERAADLAIEEKSGCIRDYDFARAYEEVGEFEGNPFEEWL